MRQPIDLQNFLRSLLIFSVFHLFHDMRAQMIFQDEIFNPGQGFADSFDLSDDIDAVFFIFYHLLDTSYLPAKNGEPSFGTIFDFLFHNVSSIPYGGV